jgi:hypothetical protein
MLRAAVSLLLHGGLHRFSTSGHPNALDAYYVAPWRLPRPDFHRLADDDFPGHTTPLLGIYRLCKPPVTHVSRESVPRVGTGHLLSSNLLNLFR